jgi:hypothetical protein
MNLHSSSIDMLAACFLPNHGSQGASNAVMNSSTYFQKDGRGVDTYCFELNGIQTPSFNATADDCLPLTLNALDLSQDLLGSFDPCIDTLDHYKEYYWAPLVRLNHAGCSEDERFISGVNSLGNSANIVFRSTANATGGNPGQLLVVAFCTSVMRVSAGRTIEVIQ